MSNAGIGRDLLLKGLNKSYGQVTSVKEVTASIGAGQFFSLLGPSGCGKTTTLMMVAGFVQPSAGRMYVDGQDLTDVPPERRGIGMVFQSYAVFPHMNVFENVAYPLRVRDVKGSALEARVSEALEMVRLSGYQARSPRQLSGGEMQRVALARSIVFKPGILLMDEPLGALDKNLREHMHVELKRIQSDLGATVVYVTHDQEEALKMSDVIAVMDRGSVQQIADPHSIYNRPSNAFVADFIGSTNTLEGFVKSVDGKMAAIQTEAGVIWGKADRKISRGSKAKLCVRPQNLLINADADGSRTGSISGTVEGRIFTGEITQYRVRTKDRRIINVHQHAVWGAPEIENGATVFLSWKPHVASVFEA